MSEITQSAICDSSIKQNAQTVEELINSLACTKPKFLLMGSSKSRAGKLKLDVRPTFNYLSKKDVGSPPTSNVNCERMEGQARTLSQTQPKDAKEKSGISSDNTELKNYASMGGQKTDIENATLKEVLDKKLEPEGVEIDADTYMKFKRRESLMRVNKSILTSKFSLPGKTSSKSSPKKKVNFSQNCILIEYALD